MARNGAKFGFSRNMCAAVMASAETDQMRVDSFVPKNREGRRYQEAQRRKSTKHSSK
jgi:hypothetical protein